MMKICTYCGVEKSLDEFNKDSRSKDLHCTQCKECVHKKIKNID